ncbi:MAG: hypothetical protein KC549_08435, partial [Myxococcales bacterium]|nr:hypothetical protein [Myxococcales bacterium]
HGATDARLVGAGTQLDWVGTTAAGLTAWLAVPGSSPGPDGEDDPALRTTLAPGAAVVAWLSPPPTGQLAHVLEADGADALWWIRHDRARRLAAPEAPTVFGLTEVKSDRRLISWSEELNRPIPLPAVFEDGPVPPRWVAPNECSGVAAEMCAGQDEDCDGAASDGLCCRDTVGGLSTAVMANDELTRDWFAGFSDEGILLAVRQGTRLRLLSHPAGDISGREARELVGYDGIHQVGFFSNQLARAVMLVDRDVPDAEPPAEGEPVPTEKRLLWFLGQVGSRDAAPPCAEVLGLRMLDNTGRTRVWCTDGAHDMNPVDGMTSAVFYPGEGGDVHWWEPNALGLADHYLVARGDDYTLQLWRRELDGTLSVSDEALPPEVALLTPEERVVPMRLPVQAGGPTARVRDGRFLEIVVPGFGWQRVPGSAWPQEARISRYDPVAVTVGFLEDPAGQDPALLQLGYILHSLQPGTPTWGVQFNPDRPNNVQGADQQGVEFGDYASGAFARPIFVTAIGQIRGGAGVVTFNATRIGCEAPR